MNDKIKSKKVKARPKIKSNKLEDFKPEYVQFNFSFITKHEKYNLENNNLIHTLLLEKFIIYLLWTGFKCWLLGRSKELRHLAPMH